MTSPSLAPPLSLPNLGTPPYNNQTGDAGEPGAAKLLSSMENLCYLMRYGACVSLDLFGTVDRTGATDMTSIVQAAQRYAVANKCNVWVSPGLYLIAGTVFTGISDNGAGGAGALFDSVAFVGPNALAPYTPGDATGTWYNYSCNAVFIGNNVNAPMFAADSVRGVTFDGIGFEGPNAQAFNFTQANVPTDVLANYNSSCRASQYSPQCAIALDGFLGAVPSDGGYPGLTSHYAGSTQSGSSVITIRNCSFYKFLIAVAVSPLGVGFQTDQIYIDNNSIKACDTAIAYGQTESKNAFASRNYITNCRQAFDGVTWGAQDGCPPAIDGNQFTNVNRLFAFVNYAGDLNFNFNYMEGCRTIGSYGIGPVGGSATVGSFLGIGNRLWLKTLWSPPFAPSNNTFYPIPPVQFECWGPYKWLGGSFSLNGGASTDLMATWNFAQQGFGNAGGAPGQLDHVTFKTSSGIANQLPFIGISRDNYTGTCRCLDCSAPDFAGGVQMLSDDGARVEVATGGYPSYGTGARVLTTYQGGMYKFGSSTVIYQPVAVAPGYSLTVSALTISAGTLTFTAASPNQVFVGDLIYWKTLAQGKSVGASYVICWQVSSVNTGTGAVVCNPMNFDPSQYDTVANQISTTSVVIAIAHFAPATATTGNISGTSVTSVSPTTLFKNNGDFINGVGIPANTRITAGAGTATLTLSQSATTGSGIALYGPGRLYNIAASAYA
jgi:hypothetical protein